MVAAWKSRPEGTTDPEATCTISHLWESRSYLYSELGRMASAAPPKIKREFSKATMLWPYLRKGGSSASRMTLSSVQILVQVLLGKWKRKSELVIWAPICPLKTYLKNVNFCRKCGFCQIVNSSKNVIFETWILPKMWFSKCEFYELYQKWEFCQNWSFLNVKSTKTVISKCEFCKNEVFEIWI